MEFDLAKHTLFLGITGSHAYGMARPESDIDVRGVAVAPLDHYTGFVNRFHQTDNLPVAYWPKLREIWRRGREMSLEGIPAGVEHTSDVQIMDLQKFCDLAANANPNILEQIFLPDRCIIGMRIEFLRLMEVRELFLSKKVRHTFAGYAHSQIKRIRGHQIWLRSPPKAPPTREEFGLKTPPTIPKDQWQAAEAMVRKRVEEWLINPEEEIPVTILSQIREAMTDMVATLTNDKDLEAILFRTAGHQLGLADNFIELLDAERRYRGQVINWNNYQTWQRERNPLRADLEAKFGYDCKHAAHVVRLTRSCEELLTTGKLNVDRTGRDADELLAIRNGAWSYDKLEEFAEEIDRRMDGLYKDPKCPLPHEPDRKMISAICANIIETFGPA